MAEQSDIVTRARESLNEIGVYYVQTLIVGRNLDDDTTILVPTRALEFVQVAPDLIRELVAKIEALRDLEEAAIERGNELQADNDHLCHIINGLDAMIKMQPFGVVEKVE